MCFSKNTLDWLVTAEYTATKVIVNIYDSKNSADAIGCFRNYSAQFHVDAFASGEIDLCNRKRNVIHAMEWPYRQHISGPGPEILKHDLLQEALADGDGAFAWADLRNRAALSPAGATALARLAAEGWTDGLTVPMHRGGTHYGIVNLWMREHVLDATQKEELTAVSLVFHERMRHHVAIEGFRLPPAGLTPREIECITLMARGFSDIKAGEILSIRGATVHAHIDQSKGKLDANNRAELVALARSFAIIPM